MCFLAAYVVALLHDGYGFPLASGDVIWVSDVAGPDEEEIAWATGAMLVEVNA